MNRTHRTGSIYPRAESFLSNLCRLGSRTDDSAKDGMVRKSHSTAHFWERSFTEDLNRHLAGFGFTCKIALEPFEIRVSSSKDNHLSLSLKYLSESEQFRLAVAFQIALAIVTGLRFVVIDRADVLDKEKRKMLTSLLLNSKLDQAIVLATSEEAPPSIVPQGVKFLGLGEGLKPREGTLSTAA